MKIIDKLSMRIALLITKTLLVSADDTGSIRKLVLDGLVGDRRSNVDHYQEFGFTSNPPVGSEAVMLSRGGSRTNNIAIATEDRRYRPKNLTPGESQIYNQFGDYVKLKADGTIEVKASTKVSITAPLVEMSGNLTVAGNITVQGNIVAVGNITGMNIVAGGTIVAAGSIAGVGLSDGAGTVGGLRSAYNSHTHSETGTTTSGPTPTA